MPNKDRGLWSTISSAQFMTAMHAKACGLIEDEVCSFCASEPQALQHLWFRCTALEERRKCCDPLRPNTARGKDIRILCQQVLRVPAFCLGPGQLRFARRDGGRPGMTKDVVFHTSQEIQ